MTKRTRSIVTVIALLALCLPVAFVCGGCSKKKSAPTYTVTFDTLGGSEVKPYKLKAGATIKRPATVPTKPSFTFVDWYADASFKTKYTFDTKMPSHNVVIYAGWEGDKSITVTYDANGGSFDETTSEITSVGSVGATFNAIDRTPVKYGYDFGGWYTDAACTARCEYAVYPADNAILYAGWQKNGSFAYASYYGNGTLLAVVPVEKNTAITLPDLFDDTISDVTWYTDQKLTSAYTFGGNLSADIDLYSAYYSKGLTVSNGAVVGYDGNADTVYVPTYFDGKAITTIGADAFYKCSVKRVVLPSTVVVVGDNAFYNCEYLTEVNLTASAKMIGNHAFYNAKRLKTAGNISGAIEIGEAAFMGCNALRAIGLGNSLTSLGDYAFFDCDEVVEATIPSKVTAVGTGVLGNCRKLQKIDIACAALTSIGAHAFEDCPSLKEIILRSASVPALETDSATKYTAFADCPDVTVYVAADKLDAYRAAYANTDKGSLADKLAALKG